MDDFIYTLTPPAMVALAVLHAVSGSLLLRRIPSTDSRYAALFSLTNPVLIQGFCIPALRAKFAAPWVASPDVSQFGMAADVYLKLARGTLMGALFGVLIILAKGSVDLLT